MPICLLNEGKLTILVCFLVALLEQALILSGAVGCPKPLEWCDCWRHLQIPWRGFDADGKLYFVNSATDTVWEFVSILEHLELCINQTLSRRVGTLQISIIIINSHCWVLWGVLLVILQKFTDTHYWVDLPDLFHFFEEPFFSSKTFNSLW